MPTLHPLAPADGSEEEEEERVAVLDYVTGEMPEELRTELLQGV